MREEKLFTSQIPIFRWFGDNEAEGAFVAALMRPLAGRVSFDAGSAHAIPRPPDEWDCTTPSVRVEPGSVKRRWKEPLYMTEWVEASKRWMHINASKQATAKDCKTTGNYYEGLA